MTNNHTNTSEAALAEEKFKDAVGSAFERAHSESLSKLIKVVPSDQKEPNPIHWEHA